MNITYDVVVATRNRPEALRLSISSVLSDQKRKPSSIIVIDASDSGYSVEETVQGLVQEHGYDIIFKKSSKANLCYQRNLGLEQVAADIVIFPDDDSIFFPGAIDEIMRIYENDTEKLIAGVCPAESPRPPSNFSVQSAYKQKKSDGLKKYIATTRYKLEHKLVPDPFHIIGKRFIEHSPDIPWLGAFNAIKVEFMTGFRMSFRADYIKSVRFNNVFDAYCLYEDTDASFSVYKRGALVGAKNAFVYHHKFPAKRGGGFQLGLWQVINRGYVVLKYGGKDKELLGALRKFLYYKLFLYILACKSSFGRDRFKGALYGVRHLNRLLKNESCSNLDSSYREIVNGINSNS